MAIAAHAIIWGIATPLVGALADKYGPGRVVSIGGVIYAGGLFMMSQASTPIDATIGIGLLAGVGMSATMFPIILSVISRVTAVNRRNLYLGIASAGGSAGMFVVIPIGQLFLDWYGWVTALMLIAVLTGLIVPLAASVAIGRPSADELGASQGLGQAIREAATHKGFLLVTGAYFVCGFQIQFIGAHFPAMINDFGFAPTTGATALTLVGLFNVFGCLAWGAASGRLRTKYLLAALYSIRSVVMTAFILLPVSETSVYIFAGVMGTLWLATVPLTSAVVTQIFGPTYVATLFGFSFLGHQLGSFLGIWLGGRLYDATGTYDAIWWTAIALGLIASLLHFPIDDRPVVRAAAREA